MSHYSYHCLNMGLKTASCNSNRTLTKDCCAQTLRVAIHCPILPLTKGLKTSSYCTSSRTSTEVCHARTLGAVIHRPYFVPNWMRSQGLVAVCSTCSVKLLLREKCAQALRAVMHPPTLALNKGFRTSCCYYWNSDVDLWNFCQGLPCSNSWSCDTSAIGALDWIRAWDLVTFAIVQLCFRIRAWGLVTVAVLRVWRVCLGLQNRNSSRQ